MDWGLLIGLLSIALAIFFGLLFGLSGFRKGITEQLSAIREKVVEIQMTGEKLWDFVLARLGGAGTIERSLANLGKIKVAAEPGRTETIYVVDIEKPILNGEFIEKLSKDTGFADKEIELFEQEPRINVFSPTRLRVHVPSVDSTVCTQYMTSFLKWLDSEYVTARPRLLEEFEKSILS